MYRLQILPLKTKDLKKMVKLVKFQKNLYFMIAPIVFLFLSNKKRVEAILM